MAAAGETSGAPQIEACHKLELSITIATGVHAVPRPVYTLAPKAQSTTASLASRKGRSSAWRARIAPFTSPLRVPRILRHKL